MGAESLWMVQAGMLVVVPGGVLGVVADEIALVVGYA